MSDSDSSRREDRQSPADASDIQFRRASEEEFSRAQAQVERAIAARPPLTEEEKKTGWVEDPISGL